MRWNLVSLAFSVRRGGCGYYVDGLYPYITFVGG